MTAINFPDTPEIGDTFSVGQITWEWTGSVWKGFTDTSANVTVSTTPPDDTGSIWFNSENGFTYIYYDSYWTSIASSSGSQIISDTAPTSPVVGMQWFNSSTGKSYLYYSDAWIEVDSNGNSASSGGNVIINGGFDIWQRGTSIATGAIAYTADRFQARRTSAAAGITISRQPSGLNDIQYAARAQRTAVNTSTESFSFGTGLEVSDVIPLVGKTATISFYARKGANYSNTDSTLSVTWQSSATPNLGYFAVATTSPTNIISSGVTLTADWERFTFTGTVPSGAQSLGLFFGFAPTGTAGANDWFEITGVQLETGTVATPFKRNAPSIQAELAACQRYYFRNSATSLFSVFAQGSAQSTTASRQLVKLPVTMRVQPTSVDFSTLRLSDGVAANPTVTALTIQSDTSHNQTMTVTAVVASGLTDFRNYYLYANNSTSAFIGFSAEL
jgi:hypothetical protein